MCIRSVILCQGSGRIGRYLNNIIITMGGFHLIMMLLGVIGTRFGDAGLRELAIESDVIAEGSIERVLNGKNYNRSLCLHKIFYETLMILFLNSFENSLSDNAELLARQKTLIEELKLAISPVGYTNLLQHDDFKTWHEAFQVFMTNLREKGSALVKFWLSYLEICELVLNLIYATRTGNWTMYLSCIEEVIPWCFAYECQNYARYLIPFLNDMLRLPSSMPEAYNAFLNGELSVQMEKQTLLVETKQTKLSKTPLTETVRPEVATSASVPIVQQHSVGC